MSRRRKGRAVHGVLLLDKPAGPSSNQALQRVRRLFQARKAGHTGTLDPFATGMLPVCFGEASKTSAQLLDASKTYEAEALLGQATTTGDSEGDVIMEAPVPHLDDAAIERVLADSARRYRTGSPHVFRPQARGASALRVGAKRRDHPPGTTPGDHSLP